MLAEQWYPIPPHAWALLGVESEGALMTNQLSQVIDD